MIFSQSVFFSAIFGLFSATFGHKHGYFMVLGLIFGHIVLPEEWICILSNLYNIICDNAALFNHFGPPNGLIGHLAFN